MAFTTCGQCRWFTDPGGGARPQCYALPPLVLNRHDPPHVSDVYRPNIEAGCQRCSRGASKSGPLVVTTSIPVTASDVSILLQDNVHRSSGTICNTSGTILYILLGAGVVSSSFFTHKLTTSSPDDFWELPAGYIGSVSCIRNSGTTPQPVLVTEVTD